MQLLPVNANKQTVGQASLPVYDDNVARHRQGCLCHHLLFHHPWHPLQLFAWFSIGIDLAIVSVLQALGR